MNPIIKTLNDLDELFQQEPKKTDNGYECPVCGKSYKGIKGITNHMKKEDCYSFLDMCKNTITETRAYVVYKELIARVNPKAKVSIVGFRKSPAYNGCCRFIMFVSLHELTDQSGVYLTWLAEIKNFNNIHALLSSAIKESFLREFRLFAQKFDQFIDSEKFYKTYRDEMIKDGKFFIRSLEKSKISLHWLLQQKDFPFEEVMGQLDADDQNRFETLANRVLEV